MTAQTPASATSKWGLGREEQEAQAAVLFKNQLGEGRAAVLF